ncbi:hypothetical protein Dda_5462 [Drechslerella dactyloides]|uniref:FAD-binding PCMH-type domain-containing protein n=1 Tax=Drechslerella dactyloides TaxID=74499 RepID=A0AAD6IW48_DREDA|nr:hypothetical protein Dda_5462 [Drechslerella dactyloides]
MATINGVAGEQYLKGTDDYEKHYQQFATSSFESEDRMRPALIVKPKNKADIATVLKYAKSHHIAVAIRTGGNQYSGASSTPAPNIQLDLKTTFKGPSDRCIFEKDGQPFIRTSVSWGLGEFQAFLAQYGLFVAHGQCIGVHLGGHVQTGGWGQLQRSFGLFGDHVTCIEIVNYQGESIDVTPESDRDLFSAILGGSPGNFGVITHITVKLYRDADYQGSRGLKSLFWYDPKILERLLNIVAEMADNDNLERNYDLCVTIMSSTNKCLDAIGELDPIMRQSYPHFYGEDGRPNAPRLIVVFAQWVPFSENDKCDEAWFERIREGSVFNLPVQTLPMSQHVANWIFPLDREFDFPYIKNIQVTKSRSLVADGWASWQTERIDSIVKPTDNKCWVSAQWQVIGGKHSKFTSSRGNGTSYSWRDSTLLTTMDLYHHPDQKQVAKAWQAINYQEGIGPNGKFSKEDRRLLWGSYVSLKLKASEDQHLDLHGNVFEVPTFTMKEIYGAIPAHCFKSSMIRSMAYVVRDCFYLSALVYLAVTYIPQLPNVYFRCAAWVAYTTVQGFVFTGIWILAHECGHGAFSKSKTLNWTMGLIMHSFLLVPFHSWRLSHSQHHKATGNIERDVAFVPHTRESWIKDNFGEKAQANIIELAELVEDSPISALYYDLIHQLCGWPAYLLFNLSGQEYGGVKGMPLSHFYFGKDSLLYKENDLPLIMLSDIGVAAMIACLAIAGQIFGSWYVIVLWGIPWLWVNNWIGISSTTSLERTFATTSSPLSPSITPLKPQFISGE